MVGWFIGILILETVIVALAVVGRRYSPQVRLARILARSSPLPHFTLFRACWERFMVGAIFAKVISTANNYLFSPATNLINDVYVRYV